MLKISFFLLFWILQNVNRIISFKYDPVFPTFLNTQICKSEITIYFLPKPKRKKKKTEKQIEENNKSVLVFPKLDLFLSI